MSVRYRHLRGCTCDICKTIEALRACRKAIEKELKRTPKPRRKR